MDNSNNVGKWEKRWHPLREEWVVYAAHRNNRPWSFDIDSKIHNHTSEYDEKCYLCAGNERVGGTRNPKYEDVFIFENDHPVVSFNSPEITGENRYTHGGLYHKEKAQGIAKVICYDPRHNVTLSDVTLDKVYKVFQAWRGQMQELSKNQKIKYVLIFENKGQEVGVSNPHPHCQIYATDFTFNLVEREIKAAYEYKKDKGRNIFHDIIQAELKDEVRIIAENKNAVAFIPFFARYAYEVMIFPKKKHATLASMSDEELHDYAAVFQEVTRRFDTNFQTNFPYVMAFHQAPINGADFPDYHLHMLIQPPLRQPGLVKYLAGPEIGAGNFMADTMPEDKAQELKKVTITQFQEAI